MQKPMLTGEQWLAVIDDDVVPLGRFSDREDALRFARGLAGPDGLVESVWSPSDIADLIAVWAEGGVRVIH